MFSGFLLLGVDVLFGIPKTLGLQSEKGGYISGESERAQSSVDLIGRGNI